MKIGIDLDGVVIDSETTFRTYEEIFDIDFLKGNNLVNKEEPKFQARYNWTDKQEEEFIKKYFLTVSKESNLINYPKGKLENLDFENGKEIKFWNQVTPISNIRIPMVLYNDIDLKNIKKCNIIFDRTNSGDLLFESIMVD